MRSGLSMVFAFVTAAGLLGCSKSAPPPGKSVKLGNVCSEADGSRVRLEGFLRYRRGLMSFCSDFGGKKTCDLALYERGDKPADGSRLAPSTGPEPVMAKLSVPVGSAAGEMDDLPKEFAPSDVKLHLASGANATDGSYVIIDGKLSVIPSATAKPDEKKSCFVTVEWVSAS